MVAGASARVAAAAGHLQGDPAPARERLLYLDNLRTSLRNGGGLVDAPGSGVVGPKGNSPFWSACGHVRTRWGDHLDLSDERGALGLTTITFA